MLHNSANSIVRPRTHNEMLSSPEGVAKVA